MQFGNFLIWKKKIPSIFPKKISFSVNSASNFFTKEGIKFQGYNLHQYTTQVLNCCRFLVTWMGKKQQTVQFCTSGAIFALAFDDPHRPARLKFCFKTCIAYALLLEQDEVFHITSSRAKNTSILTLLYEKRSNYIVRLIKT